MVYIESNFECSKTLPRNAGELTDKMKIRSTNRCKILCSLNYRSNARFESSSSANYRTNFRKEWNNGCHETSAIYRRNFTVSEILPKNREKPGNSSKLGCITFAQYCKCHFVLLYIPSLLLQHIFENLSVDVATVGELQKWEQVTKN